MTEPLPAFLVTARTKHGFATRAAGSYPEALSLARAAAERHGEPAMISRPFAEVAAGTEAAGMSNPDSMTNGSLS